VKRTEPVQAVKAPGLAWGKGDFYVPEFASHGRAALVPGAPDAHRLLFLEHAAIVEPELLTTLRGVTSDDDADGLLAWAKRWNLTDHWCLALAGDTARWYARHPGAEGWEFKGQGIFVGSFPFAIAPLRLKPFYHDPTWRSRRDFKAYVLAEVSRATENYCDQVEADALAAGLKRAPRKRGVEHFDWLARYQVKGEAFASIAETSSQKFVCGRQTVRKAIIELAKYLELNLRPPTL
jgi:hypothetical protein